MTQKYSILKDEGREVKRIQGFRAVEDFFPQKVTNKNFCLSHNVVFKVELYHLFLSWLTLLHLTGQSDWFSLYNPCIIEMAISMWGLSAIIGFHCVGYYTWQKARYRQIPHIHRLTQIFDSALLCLLFLNITHQKIRNLLLRLSLQKYTPRACSHTQTRTQDLSIKHTK